ncbi:MAG: hypothetical protein JKY51_10515 [Opitutaceae bacterium]|nr:hypothetical protein [Opitutaceae bacterium]
MDTKNNLFSDPSFQIWHYVDAEESLIVGIKKKNENENLESLTERVKPSLSEFLCKEVKGDFDPKDSCFSMDEKFVLMNSENDSALCNI